LIPTRSDEPECFDDIREFLSSLCSDLDTDNLYWVHGVDDSECWCFACCTQEVEKLRASDPANASEYIVDGGWGTEEDGQRFCAGCGKPLDCTLTDSGVKQELAHFLEYGFLSEDGTVSPVTAWELLNVFTGGESHLDDTDILVLADKIRAFREVRKCSLTA